MNVFLLFPSDNKAIADWMITPKTQFLLEFVRPEFLMLRTIARGLILWKSIHPSKNWLESNVPESIKPFCLVRPADEHPANIDYETINQAYCNVLSGAALILGIRFAGSNNRQAYNVCKFKIFIIKMFYFKIVKIKTFFKQKFN